MLDTFNIPNQQENIRIFYTKGTTDWQTWTKPRNCNFVWMMCIGGASGGSGGVSGSVSTSISVNGGGSGGIVRALFPAQVLPDVLYVQPGPGGAGGAGTTSTAIANQGGAGNRSLVSVYPSTAVSSYFVCVSGQAAATAAGAGETVLSAPTTTAGMISLGIWQATAGQAASNSSISPFSSTMLTGGTGHPGGGTQASAANINSANFVVFTSPVINAGPPNSAQNGASGIWSWKPMYGLGGAHGGGNPSGVGGNGGDGAYGCGGGAGGPGVGAPGGNGGKGGDGLVIIVSF